MIQNTEQLVRNGSTSADRAARRLALEALEAGLASVEPSTLIRSHVQLSGTELTIADLTLDLSRVSRVIVVGGGKASGAMAVALSQVLDKSITTGIVNVPRDTTSRWNAGPIELNETGHPIPDSHGIEGVREMLRLLDTLRQNDLVICLISGGGSALMSLPADGVSLDSLQSVTATLLTSGAAIGELNTVRKHLSAVKGGCLAKRAYPATVISLILSDVVGDNLDTIASGPTAPDNTTFAMAEEVLRKYDLWESAPSEIQNTLRKGARGELPETPKSGDPIFQNVHNIIIGNNSLACEAASHVLKEKGLNTIILTSRLEGEASVVGTVIASVVAEIAEKGQPVAVPGALVLGGETTVKVTGEGEGGRNQELALAASLKLAGFNGSVVASMGTDGIDGVTNAAGAIADGSTVEKATKKALLPQTYLSSNDSHTFFTQLGDLILTGPTGTNVGDLIIAVVEDRNT